MASVPPNDENHWPPRSPHEALVSSPGGRAKYRQMLSQGSPSPGRSRLSRPMPSFSANIMAAAGFDGDGDEDEETLQLKLQEIQARLRLKKLQNARAANSGPDNHAEPITKLATTTSGVERHRAGPDNAAHVEGRVNTNRHVPVEVPASPVRKPQAPIAHTSPSKLLGIDKGLTAKDISLKRAPSLRRGQGGNPQTQNDGYLRRTRAPNAPGATADTSRPLSFNERLASARVEAVSQAERQERIQKIRTNAFGIGQDEMERYKSNATEIPDEPLPAQAFSREEILSNAKAPSGNLSRSNTAPTIRANSRANSATGSGRPSEPKAAEMTDAQATSFEAYSSIHLSRRILPHTVLTRHISGAKIFKIQDLLKVIKSPDYCLPDIEQDIVVFGIVAKKSEPRAHKGAQASDQAKYMVMSLVDLSFELDLFLFKSGFTRFWKLDEGTVVAILNPQVMPPPPGRQDTGRFSLVINSDADTILEVGVSRDLGFCQSMKKDGELCGSWVNKKKTHFCEYHSNEALRKQRSKRMELNNKEFTSFGMGGSRRKHQVKEYHEPPKPKSTDYDRDTQSHWFVTKSMSAADLIDGKDKDITHQKERADFLKRSLEAKEKERDMMKKLGQIGNSAGREYMQRGGLDPSNNPNSTASSELPGSSEAEMPPPATAESLGLLGRHQAIHLSPIKRKRADSSQAGSVTSSAKGGFGWGTSLKDKLSRMKEGEKLNKDEEPPMRKRTRFVTEKGIRVAGRESLGLDLADRQVSFDNDDDDELLIVA